MPNSKADQSITDAHLTDRRPRGFMALETSAEEPILIRVVEVASVCDGPRGARLTLRSGGEVTVRQSLGAVADAMNVEVERTD